MDSTNLRYKVPTMCHTSDILVTFKGMKCCVSNMLQVFHGKHTILWKNTFAFYTCNIDNYMDYSATNMVHAVLYSWNTLHNNVNLMDSELFHCFLDDTIS